MPPALEAQESQPPDHQGSAIIVLYIRMIGAFLCSLESTGTQRMIIQVIKDTPSHLMVHLKHSV